MRQWLIHLDDGTTITDEKAYPHEIDQDKITSVERIVEGVVITLLKSDCLRFFFVKTAAYQDFMPFPDGTPMPAVIEEKILGAHILPQKTPVVIDISFDPQSFNYKIRVVPVENIPEGKSFIPPCNKPVRLEVVMVLEKKEIKLRSYVVDTIDPRGLLSPPKQG
jgi:hypothetical protein